MLYMRSHLDARTAEEGPQIQHFNSASLAGTNSAAHRGDSLEVTAQDQCSSVTVCKQQESSPLLYALLKGNPSDSKSCTTQSCLSKGSNGQIKPGPNVSGQRNCKGQQVTGSLVARNCGQTRTHLDHSGGTPPSPHQQQVYSPPRSHLDARTAKGGQQGQYLKGAPREKNNSAAQGDGLEVAAQDKCSSVTVCKQQESKIEVSTMTHFSGERNCKGQQVKGSLVARNCGQTRTHLDNSGGTPPSPHQQQVYSPPLNSQPSTDKVLAVGTMEAPTDAEIHDFIAKMLSCFKTILTHKNHKHGPSNRESAWQSDCIKPKVDGVARLPTTSEERDEERWRLNCAGIEGCTAAVGQALEEDNSKGSKANAELTATLKETDDGPTSESEKHSTEYPQIMMSVAAACTKNEDNSPGVLTAVPGMSWDDPTEKQSRLMLNHSPPWLNTNKDLDETDHVPVVSWAPNHMTERQKALRKAEGLHCVQGMTDVSEDLQTNTSSAVSENKRHATLVENRDAGWKNNYFIETHSKLHSSVCNIQINNVISMPINHSAWLSSQTSSDGEREDVASVHSQKASSMAFPENKLKKHTHPLYESEVGEACPIYEDISDEEVLQLATEPPNRKRRGIGSPTPLEAMQYEDISDAESQTGSIADETSPLAQGPEPNDRQSPFEIGGYGCVQSRALKTEIISFDKLTGLEDVLSPKCNRERRTNQSVSCANDEYETDDEMDDDYLVIPISLLGIQFEPEDKDQDSPETNVPKVGEREVLESQRDTSPTSCCSPPKLATAFPPVPVFDTQECFLQAVQCENVFEVALGMSTPEHEVDSEVEAQTPQNRRGSVDSCETENSCDYSSASESNYLTASRKMLKKRSACLPSETDVSSTEEDSEGNEVTDIQRGQTSSEDKLRCVQKPGRLPEPKASCSKHIQLETIRPLEISKRDDIVIIDSDTEDESDQKCKKRKRKTRKRLYSSDLEDSGDASCSQKRHFPESVEEKFQSNELSSAVSPAPQHQSKHEALFKEGKQKEKLQGTELTSRDLSLLPHQSKGNDTPLREVVQDECSDLSQSVKKSGQLIETTGGSDHVQHEANRQTMSKRKGFLQDSDKVVKKGYVHQMANGRGIVSSGSEQSGDDLFAAKNGSTENSLWGTANAKPQQNRMSSEDSPGKRSQSVDNEANSTWGPNPVIPRFVVESSQPSDSLILLKEPGVHRQGNDKTRSPKTSTASSKKKDSCERSKAHLPANKKVRFLLSPKPTNETPHATKNNLKAKRSLPSQEGPPTTSGSLSSTSGQLSESRQSSTSSKRLSPSGESSASTSLPSSTPRQHLSSSKLQRSHSYDNPSPLTHPPTKSPPSSATTQSSALTRLREKWKNNFFPTRRDRKTSQEDSRATNDSYREAGPGPGPGHHDRAPRQRHNSHGPATRLMKKTMDDAKKWTKAINRDAPKEKRNSVGEGYKWSEKSAKGSSRKGKRCRSPPIIFESDSQWDSLYR